MKMTDYRSDAEKFVTEFLDYMYDYDILDKLDKRTQQMVRSPGVQKLFKQAEAVFPERIATKKGEVPPKLSEEQLVLAIEAAPNVTDTREMFSKKVQENGGVRAMLQAIVEGRPDADEAFDNAREFFAAEKGEKEFYVLPKV